MGHPAVLKFDFAMTGKAFPGFSHDGGVAHQCITGGIGWDDDHAGAFVAVFRFRVGDGHDDGKL